MNASIADITFTTEVEVHNEEAGLEATNQVGGANESMMNDDAYVPQFDVR